MSKPRPSLPSLSRRGFLRATCVTAGAVLVGCGDDGALPVEEGRDHFPQSVASGDPRPDGVVVWTRFAPMDAPPQEETELLLEVAEDPEFARIVSLAGDAAAKVVASPEHDGCVKVRLTGLSPATVYYYRFVYETKDRRIASPTGRTKTAPAEDADVPVRFAFVSCQDYIGRYYDALAHLATFELDFFVHLGDYIYETNGDPGFQNADPARSIAFDDAEGAIDLGEGESAYQAARSLDNYRQLYRTYRSDPALQRLHERVPMVATWDDHEFADDSWGATATHFAGRMDETDVERRKHANQAWFEYMPVDLGEGFDYDPQVTFPDDLVIYRALRFGRHVHVFMTDERTRRSDHIVPEDAYPGAVAVTEADLMALEDTVPDAATPYVPDVATYDGGTYVAPLTAHAEAAGADPARIQGPVSVAWINTVLAELGASEPPIDDATAATLPRGISFFDLGKTSYFTRLGSRYLVAKDPFDLYARHLWTNVDPAAQTMLGDAQRTWFLDGVRQSPATWKVWGNEVCVVPLRIDLRALPIPPAFQREFYLIVEGWDGVPQRRDQILDALADTPGVVAITGDIHAFFAGTPWVEGQRDRRIFEFVTAGISSQPFSQLLAAAAGDLGVDGAEDLAANIAELLLVTGGPNPHLAFAKADHHGFVVVDADATALTTTYYVAGPEIVEAPHYDDDLSGAFEVERFQVRAGDPRLYRDFDGTWKFWDDEAFAWVE